MGYQENIPPIPSRDEQQKMMGSFKESWMQQPWNRYYMNENMRIPKMNRNYKKEYVRREFAVNVLKYTILFAPLLYLSKRFFVYRKNMPYYLDYKYNDNMVTAQRARKLMFAKRAIPLYFGAVLLAAGMKTDRTPIVDYKMSEAKDHRWL